MKRIVHIINDIDLGGAETALYRLLCAMSPTSYQFFVIVLNKKGHYSASIAALDVPIYHLEMKKKNSLKACWQLATLLREIRPHVVQTWMYHADLLGGIIAKLCGIQHILWGIRCEGDGLKMSTRWVKRGCSLLSWFVPRVILCNSKAAAMKHSKAGYCAKKMRVIPNGFDTTYFSPDKKKTSIFNHYQLPTNAFLIGTLARFHHDKDYPMLIRAIDMVCTAHKNVYFVFCGKGCSLDNGALQKMLFSVAYRHRIILLNGVEDTRTYLNSLDLFVLPSRTESFPNCLAEAMLCELPCIATDVGETKNILGTHGFIIPPQHPTPLAMACLTMINENEKARKTMGILARKHILRHYSMAQFVEKMVLIYNE